MEYYSDEMEFEDDDENEDSSYYDGFFGEQDEDDWDENYEFIRFKDHIVESLPYCNLGFLTYPYFEINKLYDDEIILN